MIIFCKLNLLSKSENNVKLMKFTFNLIGSLSGGSNSTCPSSKSKGEQQGINKTPFQFPKLLLKNNII